MYEIVKVDRLLSERIEYLGTKRKFWYTQDGRRYLFKAEERGTGEDWAEKIVCQLAELLGIPHVNYELAAEFEGPKEIQPGVICPTMLSEGQTLFLGNQLIGWMKPDCPSDEQKRYNVRECTIQTAAESLDVSAPPQTIWTENSPEHLKTAKDYFCGYLMLDAWVANQDRHHQNWGAIGELQEDGGYFYLAPSFDHGASLARNIRDEERKERLETKDQGRAVEAFAKRARSGFYKTSRDKKTLLALDAFNEIATIVPEAGKIWLERLSEIPVSSVNEIIDEVPPQRMTPITKRFTLELLNINKARLLDASD